MLPWACVALRALPRRSADRLPKPGRGGCRDTGHRPPLPAGRRTLAPTTRTNRGSSADVGSWASSSSTDPANRLRGARRDAARGGGVVPTSLRPATCQETLRPPRCRRSCSTGLARALDRGRSASRPARRPAAGAATVPAPPPKWRRRSGAPTSTEVWWERTEHRRGGARSAGSEERADVRAKSPRGLRGRCAPPPKRRGVHPRLPRARRPASPRMAGSLALPLQARRPCVASLATRRPRHRSAPEGAPLRRSEEVAFDRCLAVLPHLRRGASARLAGAEDRLP